MSSVRDKSVVDFTRWVISVVVRIRRLELWTDIGACLLGHSDPMAIFHDKLLTSQGCIGVSGGELTNKTDIPSFQTLTKMYFVLTIPLNRIYSHLLRNALIKTGRIE